MKIKYVILAGGDVLLAILAFLSGFMLRFGIARGRVEILGKHPLVLLVFVATVILCSYVFDVYSLARHRSRGEIFRNILIGVGFSFIILSMVFFLNPLLLLGRGVLALALTAFVLYQFLWHLIFIAVLGHPLLAEKVVILGTGDLAVTIGALIEKTRLQFNHSLLGYIADELEGTQKVPPEAVLGKTDCLLDLALQEKISRIIVALENEEGHPDDWNILLNCKFHGIEVVDSPGIFEELTGKLMLERMNVNWLVYASGFRRTMVISLIKRLLDIIISAVGLLLTLPLFPLIAILVKLDSPGPLFFSQERVGFLERRFTLYKFRTMPTNAEAEGAVWAQRNDPRVGTFGRMLRKWRFDEIPQMYNVLKGDMSFVGPRPERPEFVEKLARQIPFYSKRHFLKPGITGWAQVKFPYGASVEDAYEKLRYDLFYIKNLSLFLDTVIVLKTFRVVIFGDGGR